MNTENNKKIHLMMSAAICALQLFVLAPLSVYFTNLDEMNIALLTMLKLALIPTLLMFLILVLAGSFFPKRIHNSYIALIAAISTLIWLQGNVMLWDYGLLDGRLIDWGKDSWRGWVDISVWLIAIIAALWLTKSNKKIVLNAAVAIFVLQLLTTAFMVVQHRDKINLQISDSEQSLENIHHFSDTKNVLHLMVDGFQSDVFNDLISIPGLGDYYRKSFGGFTYYPETLGVFPYTRFSIPAFLGGQLYNNDMPQDDFVDRVLSGKNILNLAYNNNYEVDIVAGGAYLEKRYSHLKHNNLYNPDNISSPMEETAKIIDLALFRAAPHFLKSAVYNQQKWRVAPIFAAGKAGMQFYYFKHTYFFNNWIVRMDTGREKPVYKYIHVMNTHNPMVVNAACNYDGKVSPMTRQPLTIQTKCTLDTLLAVFDKMKSLGIYDNALIIIQGDHGGWTGNHRSGLPIKFYNGVIAPEWVASLASPMLAIKLPQQTGDIVVSKKLVSLADLPDSISDIMGWGGNFGHQSIMTLDENTRRERIFRFYGWRKNEWSEKYAAPIQEFVVKGSHYETEWQAGKVYLPPEH